MFIGSVFKETPRRLKMPEESFHLDFGPVFRIEERILHCTFDKKSGDLPGESKAYHVGKVTTYVYKLICTVANDYLASGMRKEDVLVIPEEDVEQAIISGYYNLFDTTRDVTPFAEYLEYLATGAA